MNNIKSGNNGLIKFGGIAALYGAFAYIITMVVFLVVLDYPNIIEPADKVTMLVNNQFVVMVLHWLSYIIFGVLLVVLALALYEKNRVNDSLVMKLATVFAIMWATLLIASGLIFNHGVLTISGIYNSDPDQAILIWQSVEIISSALSFADGELLGGMWMLLVGISAMQSKSFSKALNVLSISVGIIGIISIIPILNIFSALFGLGQIVWFVWIGIHLLKNT